MVKADIVIIDSGLNGNVLESDSNYVGGIHIFQENNSVVLDYDIEDMYGHGTAVYNIISKNSDAKIFVIKVFENQDMIDETVLLYSLEYVKSHISCKVINLSMGLKICNDKQRLKMLCDEIMNQEIVIVSAFDNEGCYSYPAVFEKVIGIGNSYKCKHATQFEYVENSPINILAKGGLQRVLWNDKNIIIGGSSFACAHMSANIFNLTKGVTVSHNELLKILKEKSIFIHPKKQFGKNTDDIFEIKKAAVFPVNKEMHSLIRYSNKLSFSIQCFYDIRQSGRVGANIKNVIQSNEKNIDNAIIEDINNIDLDTIDTLIIGHMEEINRITEQDMRLSLVKKAIEKKVNVFSFDSLEYCNEEIKNRQAHIYYPSITMFNVPQNTFGKLYNIDKPVISIFGTSSQQGKFTLQLKLKEIFEKYNYRVGTIGTEPHSLLFDMDSVYPMGYNSSIYIDGHSSILLLNKMLNDICEKDVELIITSSQANTIPYSSYNVTAFPIKQHIFLLGIQPDVVILSVNANDDLDYITNTIKYVEGLANTKVICLVVFPMLPTGDWRGIFGVKRRLCNEEANEIKKRFSLCTGLPTFMLGEESEIKKLTDLIINYLS